MASRAQGKRAPDWRTTLKRSLFRLFQLVGAASIFGFSVFLALCLLSYHGSDPSMNTVAGDIVQNIMGRPGAYTADFMLWLLGIPGFLTIPLIAIFARRLWGNDDMSGWQKQMGSCVLGILLVGLALALFSSQTPVGLPAGRGGIIALLTATGIHDAAEVLIAPDRRWFDWLLGTVCIAGGITIWYKSLRLDRPLFSLPRPRLPRFGKPSFQLFRAQDDDDDTSLPETATVRAPGRRWITARARRSTLPRPPALRQPRVSPRSRARTICSATARYPRPNCSARYRHPPVARSTVPHWNVMPACSKACSTTSM